MKPFIYKKKYIYIYIVMSGGAMARKCSFGKPSHEITTRTFQFRTPLAHLLRGPQYADWSTIHLCKDVQTLVIFDGISDLVSTALFKHLQNTMLQESSLQLQQNYMISIYSSIPRYGNMFQMALIDNPIQNHPKPNDYSKDVVKARLIILSGTI